MFGVLPALSQYTQITQWEGNYYVDRCLLMGYASSCKTFETLSTAIEWVARNKLAIPNTLHILDDFLILAFKGFYIFVSTLVFPWLQIKRKALVPY